MSSCPLRHLEVYRSVDTRLVSVPVLPSGMAPLLVDYHRMSRRCPRDCSAHLPRCVGHDVVSAPPRQVAPDLSI